jgi:hypothetical protein
MNIKKIVLGAGAFGAGAFGAGAFAGQMINVKLQDRAMARWREKRAKKDEGFIQYNDIDFDLKD